MSGEEKSGEDFLARWSRRKREVEVTRPAETPPPTQPISPTSENETSVAAFDPATLPPIDSITALSDIRDFLRAGVPPELTRAALRRVWTADPAIRDFVGLAENAWDFTDPNAMPGFGPLEATDDVRQMVAQIMARIPEPAELAHAPALDTALRDAEIVGSSGPAPDGLPTPGQSDTEAAHRDQVADASARIVTDSPEQRAEPAHVAMQQDQQASAGEKQLPRRIHGSALPH